MFAVDGRVMAGAETTMGIDIGTTSVKGVVADGDGNVVARVRIPHRLHIPAPDRMEHDAAQAWVRGPKRVLASLVDEHRPRAVAVSAMVPSMTSVDRRGRPLTPGLLYGDERGRGAGGGNPAASGEAVEFLKWSAAQRPDAAGFWSAPAVANAALGGEGVLDFATAFTTGPLFGSAGAWDERVCEECGITPAQLPRVDMMGAAVGRVTSHPEVVLAAGSIDAMCEQIVAGADDEGDVIVLCGTTMITWAVIGEERQGRGLWTIPHTAPGKLAIGGPSNAGGLFLGWVDRLFGAAGRDLSGVDPARVPVFSPYIRGERTPYHDPVRRAVLDGLDLTHGPAAIRRAAFEAAGFVVRHHLDLAGVDAKRLVATGGGTRVAGWMEALADCTGLPVDVADVPEGAALGAAFLARQAIGLESSMNDAARWARTGRRVEPDARWSTFVDTRYARFRELGGPESPVDQPGQ